MYLPNRIEVLVSIKYRRQKFVVELILNKKKYCKLKGNDVKQRPDNI